MNKILAIENIDVYYEEKRVLHNINLEIFENDFIGIIGPNGGGKTSLVKVILGIIPFQKGRIYYQNHGNEIASIPIGYLPQELRVDMSFPISVREVILSGLSLSNKRLRLTKNTKSKVEEVIQLLGLEEVQKSLIGNISGGQLQRTLLGRSIISSPQLLILDEPNTYMDQQHEHELYALLENLNKKMAIIIVSHNIDIISNHVQRIIHIDHTLKTT